MAGQEIIIADFTVGLGRDWPYDEAKSTPANGFGLRAKQPKGHKWQKERALR